MPSLRIFALLAILAVTLTGCQRAPAAAPAADQAAPTPASDANVVSATGVVVPIREAALSVQASGRLVEILVTAGDEVQAGQELARVDTRDLQQTLANAEAGLKLAEAGLAKAKAGARTEEIASAQAGIRIAEAGAATAGRAKTVAEGNVVAAKADQQAAASAVEVALGNQASAQAAVDVAQANLEKVLEGATPGALIAAKTDADNAKAAVQVAQAAYDKIRGSADVGASPQALELERATNAYDAAVARLADLKQGATKAEVAAARAGLSQARAGVQTAVGQVAQARAQAQRAEANVKIAEAQVEQAQSQVESAQAQILQAQAQLDLVKAGTRPEDIAAAEAEVARAEAAVTAARNALDDATLRAPFAGTIGEVLVDQGELVTPQVPILRLGDLTRLRVRTEDLGEGDVALVRTGQPARVTVDALPDREFAGTVVRVAPLAIERRGDKIYDALVDLDLPAEAGIRWGMSTFVEINVR
jgi:HlyD family secretion protein